MKIPLTFLLSLTFLFLFSGSVDGDEPETNLKDKTFNQTSLAPEKTYKRNPYFPFYTKGWHILISGLSEQKYGWYFYVPILLLVYWMGRTKAPLLSMEGIGCGVMKLGFWFAFVNTIYYLLFY